MAKSTAPSCAVLFIQSGDRRAGQYTVRPHRHGFWQAELCLRGAMTLTGAGDAQRVGPQDLVLIPPGVLHGFHYRGSMAFLSVKFTAQAVRSAPSAIHVPAGDSPAADLRLALVHLSRPGPTAPAAADVAPAVAGVLTALLALAGLVAAGEAPRPVTMAGQVADLVRPARQRAWTVAGVARALGRSPNHVSATFLAETGQHLKRWLDQQRADAAAALLQWSDDGIGQVAAQCGFPDQFAFSRFFRRVMGLSPRAWRRRVRG